MHATASAKIFSRLSPLVAVVATFLMFAGCSAAVKKTAWQYRGFNCDVAQVADDANLEALRAAWHTQIDIVLSVGLPDETISFFKTIPFRIVPATTVRGRQQGSYTGHNGSVQLTTSLPTYGQKPILLHEFMHAYHDKKLPDGFRNRDMITFFQRAKSGNFYAANSHMMENPLELFACAATSYLFGVTAQEPFAREKVKTSQPRYYEFLENLFGPNAGKFQGSLTPNVKS